MSSLEDENDDFLTYEARMIMRDRLAREEQRNRRAAQKKEQNRSDAANMPQPSCSTSAATPARTRVAIYSSTSEESSFDTLVTDESLHNVRDAAMRQTDSDSGSISHHGLRAREPARANYYNAAQEIPPTSTIYRPRPRNRRNGFRIAPAGEQSEEATATERNLYLAHKYMCNALEKNPELKYKQSAITSIVTATVLVNENEYGRGYGYSRYEARVNATRSSMKKIIPELHEFLNPVRPLPSRSQTSVGFDSIPITDPLVVDCVESTQQTAPFDVLLKCLDRIGYDVTHVRIQTRRLKHKRFEVTMYANQHRATVRDESKTFAKQRAAQDILQTLHPAIMSYGSLLRLYGIKFGKNNMSAKQKWLLMRGSPEGTRYLLNKLHQEMKVLRKRDAIYARAAAAFRNRE